MKYKAIFLWALALTLSSCAGSPESDPAYVSPNHYADFNCNHICAEMQRVSSKIEQAEQANTTGQVLETALAAYAISRGYGFSGGDDSQYRRLVNQYDVLEQTAIRKECLS